MTMTKREQLWEKVKTTIVNTKWTDSSLVSFARTALNCDECPVFATCDHTSGCCETLFDWLRAHGDEKVKMTNREWLQTLTDEEFARMMWYSCDCCVGQGDLKKCHKQPSCRDGRLKWLKQKHTEN